MRVKYFYPWGFFYPPTAGADRVAQDHLDYFHTRGWEVDCILNGNIKPWNARAFAEHYPWLRSLRTLNVPDVPLRIADLLFSYARLAERDEVRRLLTEPADVFFTNYFFTCSLLPHLPDACKRVVETHDLMAGQFCPDSGAAAASTHDSVATAVS